MSRNFGTVDFNCQDELYCFNDKCTPRGVVSGYDIDETEEIYVSSVVEITPIGAQTPQIYTLNSFMKLLDHEIADYNKYVDTLKNNEPISGFNFNKIKDPLTNLPIGNDGIVLLYTIISYGTNGNIRRNVTATIIYNVWNHAIYRYII